MTGTPKDTLAALTSAWGIPDTTTHDAVIDSIRRVLHNKGLDMVEASLRNARAIISVPPHQAHLAKLLTDDLARAASKASSGHVTSVRVTAAYPHSPTTRKAEHEH